MGGGVVWYWLELYCDGVYCGAELTAGELYCGDEPNWEVEGLYEAKDEEPKDEELNEEPYDEGNDEEPKDEGEYDEGKEEL